MSILRDLDPSAAKFPDGGRVAKSRSFIWVGALLLLGGVATWSLISAQNGTALRASTFIGQEGKVEAPNLRSLDKKNEGNPINPPVSDARVVAAAPAVIRDRVPPQSGLPGVEQSVSVPADIKSAGIERDVRQLLPATSAEPVVVGRADGGGGRSANKNDRASRGSPSTIVSAKGKDGGGQSNRTAQRERQATERDIDIITVLVK